LDDQPQIRPLAGTGIPRVDDILRGVVGIYEAVFAGRVCSYYLEGSYAAGSQVPASDIDMFVLFDGKFEAGEEERARSVREACRLLSPIRLDLPARALTGLQAEEPFVIRYASTLVYGRDVASELSLPPAVEYARQISEAPHLFIQELRDGRRLMLPLDYPDPAGEFFGYDRPLGQAGYPTDLGLKKWVLVVCWIATALVAIEAEQVTLRKDEAPAMYRAHIGDGWADFVDQVYHLGKESWRYLLPESPSDRAALRRLCRRTLALENHFMDVYRRQLLAELASDEPARQSDALRRLLRAQFDDPLMIGLLRELAAGGEKSLSGMATQVLVAWSSP
jgi:predicted nucleotidyltransferase